MSPDVVIIGCGNMGCALAAGYHARVPEGRLLVVDRNVDRVRATLPPGERVRVVATIAEIGQVRPGMTVLATKPQVKAAILPLLAPLPAARGLVVSIAAGVGAASTWGALPAARIVRAMPNTPASVGAGATGLWSSGGVSEEGPAALRSPVRRRGPGALGVAGGGHRCRHGLVRQWACLSVRRRGSAGAGRAKAGLEAPLTDELARATVIGTAAMLERSSSGPATLKAAVRSPGGTTDAALRVFEDGNALALLFGRAVAAAHARARGLCLPMDAATGRQAGGPAWKPAPLYDRRKAPHC